MRSPLEPSPRPETSASRGHPQTAPALPPPVRSPRASSGGTTASGGRASGIPASADFHIFRLDRGTQTWTDTGVALDDRPGTRADILWDAAAGKLYVASHRFSESPATGFLSRLSYSYNASTDTYTRDSGFPVTINNFATETLVIDKDSSGQLWATWVQGGKVWVNASVCNPACNDASWGTAFPLNPVNVDSDDIPR